MTFRMRGHEEASGVKYVPKQLLEAWAEKDPITNYENWLVQEQIIQAEEVTHIRSQLKTNSGGSRKVFEWPDDPVVLEDELADVYKAFDFKELLPPKDAAVKTFVLLMPYAKDCNKPCEDILIWC